MEFENYERELKYLLKEDGKSSLDQVLEVLYENG